MTIIVRLDSTLEHQYRFTDETGEDIRFSTNTPIEPWGYENTQEGLMRFASDIHTNATLTEDGNGAESWLYDDDHRIGIRIGYTGA